MRKDQLPKTFTDQKLNDLFLINKSGDCGLFCYTSQNYLKKAKYHGLSCTISLTYPVIPDVLQQLTLFEERIVSPRHKGWPIIDVKKKFRSGMLWVLSPPYMFRDFL